MVHLAALVIFFLITAVTWYAGVALYQSLAGGPDLRLLPQFRYVSAVCVCLVTLFCFVPFPWGYLIALFLWGLYAKQLLELPWPRALLLFLVLAALSFVSRLAILGALHF